MTHLKLQKSLCDVAHGVHYIITVHVIATINCLWIGRVLTQTLFKKPIQLYAVCLNFFKLYAILWTSDLPLCKLEYFICAVLGTADPCIRWKRLLIILHQKWNQISVSTAWLLLLRVYMLEPCPMKMMIIVD